MFCSDGAPILLYDSIIFISLEKISAVDGETAVRESALTRRLTRKVGEECGQRQGHGGSRVTAVCFLHLILPVVYL